jgi:hypothetical protein
VHVFCCLYFFLLIRQADRKAGRQTGPKAVTS